MTLHLSVVIKRLRDVSQTRHFRNSPHRDASTLYVDVSVNDGHDLTQNHYSQTTSRPNATISLEKRAQNICMTTSSYLITGTDHTPRNVEHI
jgi:hypothetical protein